LDTDGWVILKWMFETGCGSVTYGVDLLLQAMDHVRAVVNTVMNL
jgi:hypothetical protein